MTSFNAATACEFRLGAARSFHRVLLVEYRDEVFIRLAADLAEAGILVQRASSAEEASRRHPHCRADLILVHALLPDENGWLLVQKLRAVDREVPIWVYTPWASSSEAALAEFVQADALIYYRGDLLRLASQLLERMEGPNPFSDWRFQGEVADCVAFP